MSTIPFSEQKRQDLKRRTSDLQEEYQATSNQLGTMLSKADQVILQRKLAELEIEIRKCEDDLKKLEESTSDSPSLSTTPIGSVAILAAPDQDVLERFSHWTDDRLLSSIQAHAGSPDQDLDQMVKVLCWRLREKQEAKMKQLEQLQTRHRNLQQSRRFVPQKLRHSIRDVSRDVRRLENLAAQAKRYCASEDTNPQD